MDVTALRRFSRVFTERIGALDDRYLDRDRPLGEARLLFEIGLAGPDPVEVGDLRDTLDLDTGYTSRLLRSLERDGLIVVGPSPLDGRRRVAGLTIAGRAEWEELDRRSAEQAAAVLAPLGPERAAELGGLLDRARRLLDAAAVHVAAVDPREPAAARALAAYVAELDRRFPAGFDPGDPVGDPTRFEPPAGVFVLARLRGATVGCGGLTAIDDRAAEVKRMWVDPSARGLGIGTRLLADLEQRARDAGRRVVRLDTNSTLNEAIAMYERAGYRRIERYNDNADAELWFEKDL